MPYSSELETRIAKKVTKAITDYNLIEDGDRVMVGLSGGKDSWALLQILDVLRQRAPIDFSLVAVNVDSGYEGYEHDADRETCAARGWECRIEHTQIGEAMDDLLDDERDAVLAVRAAAPRRALSAGHRGRRDEDRARPSPRRLHRDAAAEPVLCRRAQGDAGAARLRQRRARRHSSARLRHSRPRREPTRRTSDLPIIGCCCPACGDLSLQRQRVKRLIARARGRAPGDQELDAARARQRRERHLLDRRLNPLPELRHAAARVLPLIPLSPER